MTGNQLEGYLAFPENGSGAGVLVLHAWWGLNPFFKKLCDRLAGVGFVAYAPDLYHGQIASTIEEAETLSNRLDHNQVEEFLHRSIEFIERQEAVTCPTLGVIGFSLGAFFALGMACEFPNKIGAVVCFYGTGECDFSSARASFQGHFADIDEWESPDDVTRLEQRLQASHKSVKFYTYRNTGHWFFEKDRKDAYNPKAANLAWRRSVTFLRKTLEKSSEH